MDGHANTQHAHEVAVLMVFWDCLRVIGLFYFWWSYWISQSQSDKTVFALGRSPMAWGEEEEAAASQETRQPNISSVVLVRENLHDANIGGGTQSTLNRSDKSTPGRHKREEEANKKTNFSLLPAS